MKKFILSMIIKAKTLLAKKRKSTAPNFTLLKNCNLKRPVLILATFLFCIISNATVHKKGLILDEHWTKDKSPYIIDSAIFVASLKIDPGVEVRFSGNYIFEVGGILKAIGSPCDSIRFTKDTSVTWQGIKFQNSIPGSEIAWCIIEYANTSGIRLIESFPKIHDCTIRNNSSSNSGGGLNITFTTIDILEISNCVIAGNTASESNGGGSWIQAQKGFVKFKNCIIKNNKCTRTNGYAYGGGVFVQSNSEFILCIIENNLVGGYSYPGGAFSAGNGGGIYVSNGNVNFSNTIINGNLAEGIGTSVRHAFAYGGGININNGNAAFFNSIITNNTATSTHGSQGGGLFINSGQTTIENCTFAYNNPDAIHNNSDTINVVNSILYFNNNNGAQLTGKFKINYSDVQGGYPGMANINFHPLFQGPGKYKIVFPSPCIDAGNPGQQYNDFCFPPSLGTILDDMGAHGGPKACIWNDINNGNGGLKLVFYHDTDHDGFGNLKDTVHACTAPSDYVTNNTDCNDKDAAIHPGAMEVCDGIDNDCDGQTDSGTLEAEKALINGAAVVSNQPGFTGSGFVDYKNNSGDFIEWTLNTPAAAAYLLKFKYANGATIDRPLKLDINGVTVSASLSFSPTGSYAIWSVSSATANFKSGANKIRLSTIGSNGSNIDNLVYTPVACQSDTLEAEQAVIKGAEIKSDQPGYTGSGYVDYKNNSGDFIEWTINTSTGGTYLMKFRYANGAAIDRQLKLQVNGVTIDPGLDFPPTGGWGNWAYSSATVNINAGLYRIRLTSIGFNGPNVDHLVFSFKSAIQASQRSGAIKSLSPAFTDLLKAHVAPNPVEGGKAKLILTTSSNLPVNLQLVDMSGKTYRSLRLIPNGLNTFNLPVNNLPPGYYTVILQQGNLTTHARLVMAGK